PLPALDATRYVPAAGMGPSARAIEKAAAILRAAQRPILLMGRVSRDVAAWDARVALAERLGARVVTDLKVGAAFPTDHALHVGAPALLLQADAAKAIAEADAIVSLDWVDLAGTLRTACAGEPSAKVIQISLDHLVHGGWSMDYQGLPPVDCFIAAEPDATVPALLDAIGPRKEKLADQTRSESSPSTPPMDDLITTDDVAAALRAAVKGRATSLAHLPLSWNGASWHFGHPLDFLGSDGGGGIGGGPGIAVGAALALRDSGRLTVAVCGDGDFLMGATALWTAAHYRIPLLIVVANNRSFYNDEVHQERVARTRGRPVENKWIGQRIADPDIDIAAIARAQGAQAWGPIMRQDALAPALREAVASVDRGSLAVVDVRVQPGYTPAMSASLTRAPR
ncbi:MAG: thiamine pyrophosphate-binding protein, partial [Betaproteobacteria bacterium]